MKSCKFWVALCFAAAAQAQQADSLLSQYASYTADTNKVNLLYEKSFAFRNTDLPAAIAFAKACHTSAVKTGDKNFIGKALNLCGILKSETGMHAEALRDLQQALELRLQKRDTLSQAILLNNIGNVYSAMGNYPRALASYENALRLASSVHNERWVNGALYSIAELQTGRGMYRQAQGNFYTLIGWAEERNDYEILGLCYQNMSICKLNLGDTAAAEAYITQALDVAEMTEDDLLRADALCSAGGLATLSRNYADAAKALSEALAICARNNYSDGLLNAWKRFSEYYHATGAHQEAYAFLLKHDSAKAAAANAQVGGPADLWTADDTQAAEAQGFAAGDHSFLVAMLSLCGLLLVVSLAQRNHGQEA